MKYEMRIQGMTCTHCQARVLQALREVSGVLAAEVNLQEGTAWIDALPEVAATALVEAVEDWGYQVTALEQK